MAKCGREQFSHEILYLADGQYYSHYLLAREMAKILNENYCVTFLIATYEGKNTHHVNLIQEVQNLLSEDIKAILLPIDQEYENSKFYTSGVGRLPSNWDQENITTNLDIYWKMTECRSVTFFQTVIKNVPVYVDGRDYGIFEWLKHQNYQLGIAEIGSITSGFALFNELGIEKTIATTATPAIPVFYHFLGLKIPIDVPALFCIKR
uniref:Glucuronosyltransferase n=1 Tax=Meloidogyne incognita TaxID=6306 RepID=A0A914NF57_MELIC